MADVTVGVIGGGDGIEARYDDLTATAGLVGQVGLEAAERGLRIGTYLTRPNLILDPPAAMRFEALLVRVVAQLGELAARCADLDVQLRAAAMAYLAADRLGPTVIEVEQACVTWPGAVRDATAATVRRRDPVAGLERLIAHDPNLTDLLVRAVDLPELAQGASLLFPDGAPRVATVRTGPAELPRRLPDLVSELVQADEYEPGTITVLSGHGADGRRQVVVDVPGTKSWSVARYRHDVTSLATNLRALDGRATSYEAGVLIALRRAGARPGDSVTFVGHSEGGMVALGAAIRGPYRDAHVLALGAPLGLLSQGVPEPISVLAIENSGDAIPHLDGRANPDRVNVTTATVRRNHGSLAANHDLRRSYLPGAREVEACDAPAVRAYLAGLADLFAATDGVRHQYRITRGYP